MVKTKARRPLRRVLDYRCCLAVVVGAILLAASSSQVAGAGTIVGSFHDLAHVDDVHVGPSGWSRTYDDYNQVCVYCHTPHNANPDVQGGLWNRPSQSTTYTIYSSPTLDSAPGQPGRASKLCLSCHDGTLAVDTLTTYPRTGMESAGVHGTMVYPRQQAFVDCGSCHQPGFGEVFGDFSRTYFNNKLNTSHPVGIAYPSVPDMVPLPADGKFANGVRVVDGRVECISCHDPHDPTVVPFLVTADNGSALCYTCHNK